MLFNADGLCQVILMLEALMCYPIHAVDSIASAGMKKSGKWLARSMFNLQ